ASFGAARLPAIIDRNVLRLDMGASSRRLRSCGIYIELAAKTKKPYTAPRTSPSLRSREAAGMGRGTIIGCTAGLLGSLLAGCIYPIYVPVSIGWIDGRVIDRASGRPLIYAFVVGNWYQTAVNIAHGGSVCAHVETTTSNAEGRYQLARWGFTAPDAIQAYKPGYEWRLTEDRTVFLESFSGTVDERFQSLGRLLSGTSCRLEIDQSLYRLRLAVYEEANALAQTSEQRSRVQVFKDSADDSLVNFDRPTTYGERGRIVNVNPRDAL